LIVKQLLFELGAEIFFGVVYHESQQIGVCQCVLLVERQEEASLCFSFLKFIWSSSLSLMN